MTEEGEDHLEVALQENPQKHKVQFFLVLSSALPSMFILKLQFSIHLNL